MIKKLYEYIHLDVKNENENKQFAVALRFLSLSSSLLYLFFGVLSGINGDILLSIYGFASSAGFISVFYLTYKDATRFALLLHIVVVIIDAFIFTYYLGWEAGFQYYLIGTILLIFFANLQNNSIKFIYSIFTAILFWILHDMFLCREMEDTKLMVRICGKINLFNLFLQISMISYYLSYHANKVERKLMKYNEKLKIQASIDPLTNILNRRSMMEYLHKRLLHYCINREGFSVSIGDIDFFKKVNDTYGHECGDIVLKEIAGLIKEFMKEKGNVSRWGGEEFLICIENVNVDEANLIIWELLKLIQQKEIRYKEETIKITMTFGVVEFDPYKGLEETIKLADELLYQGKEAGRNRVMY